MLNTGEDTIKISVIGGGNLKTDCEEYNMAFQVGKNIAGRKAILVCGGLAGVMEAACKGAKSLGGLTIGILPTTEASSANRWVDIKIPTGLGSQRNALVVLASDAVISIDGAEGTLSEIGFCLIYKKPLVGLKTWDIKPYRSIPYIMQTAATPREAVDMAFSLAAK